MSSPIVAIYARVSSEQHSLAHTIESQLAALRERVAADGVSLTEQEVFSDEGFSGATQVASSPGAATRCGSSGWPRPPLRPSA